MTAGSTRGRNYQTPNLRESSRMSDANCITLKMEVRASAPHWCLDHYETNGYLRGLKKWTLSASAHYCWKYAQALLSRVGTFLIQSGLRESSRMSYANCIALKMEVRTSAPHCCLDHYETNGFQRGLKKWICPHYHINSGSTRGRYYQWWELSWYKVG